MGYLNDITTYISGLYLPGAVALWAAVVFSLAAVWGYSLVLRGEESARSYARRAYGFFALAVTLASLVMLVALLRRDFRVEYVYQYSGVDLDWHYQLAAFWAGQKGSFLIWLFWGALLGIPLARTAGRHEAQVMGIYCLTQIGLLFILVRENPFIMLSETPLDGAGLNPLLQDDWMVIHPPIMFIGYALGAIPFCFAAAALWRREYDSWARRAFPWTLAGFLVLGCAILMGGYWAYKTLGWGGYWGWDPVENASVIPWLIGVTLIHGLYLERSKGRYRKANLILACLVYLSVLYGTFLTRSGVLADFSVHSFVDLGISGWLIGLMATFIGIALWLLVTRWRGVPVVESLDPVVSKGTFLVLSTIAVLLSAVLITMGTSAPLLTGFMENPSQVGPEFYNHVNMPIALLVVLLLAFVPFFTWKGELATGGLRKIAIAALLALGITVGAGVAGVDDPLHLLFVFFASAALLTNLQKTFSRVKVGGLASAGGWLSHVGVGVILLGFLASSAYDESAKVTLEQGVTQDVNGLQLTFKRMIPRQGREKERMEIEVVREDGSSYLSYPRLFVNDRTRQVMAHPHIRNLPWMDLYISPIDFDPGRSAGAPETFQLAKGEAKAFGETEIRFVSFQLSTHDGSNPMNAMAAGQPITIGAGLEVSSAAGTTSLMPTYIFFPNGQFQAPTLELPGGGLIRVSGINAGDGAVQLQVAGLATDVLPAKLSVDVTRKPLINLVWYGLYIILFGGGLAAVHRYLESRRLEPLEARVKAEAQRPPAPTDPRADA